MAASACLTLLWVETVFSLVWAVVSVQHGAAAMTECGLIPALLNVVQLNMDGQVGLRLCSDCVHMVKGTGFGGMGKPFQRRYVVSQAVQIMETAVVNNAAALSAFRDLGAAEVLASAFSTEVGRLRDAGAAAAAGDNRSGGGCSGMVVDDPKGKAEGKGKSKKQPSSSKTAKGKGKGRDNDGKVKGTTSSSSSCSSSSSTVVATGGDPDGVQGGAEDDASSAAGGPLADPSPSQKALLFSLLNALSITFQNQVGSDPLLEAFLTAAVMDVFRNSDMFGGVLVALTATLISDVANQDPSTTVPYLLRSGIVDEYLKVLTATPATPAPPPSSDLLVTVPNVLHALCLTHDGASRVQEANVFPASRYPEGNMTSVVGAGLDELMRHVPALRPQCIKALVSSLKELVGKGDELLKRELAGDSSAEVLNERTLMQQYAANFGQLLESALGRPENAKPFADAGGDEVLLSLFSLAVPGPRALLARASCAGGGGGGGTTTSSSSSLLSSSQQHSLANHAASQALTSAMKALGTHDTARLLKRVLVALDRELDRLDAARKAVMEAGGMSAAVASASGSSGGGGGGDAMDVDSEASPAAAKSPSKKSVAKANKGKGKNRAASTRAVAAAAAAAAASADGGDGDSDVDMSGAVEGKGPPAAGNGRAAAAADSSSSSSELDMLGVLECIPREPVYVAWPVLPAEEDETADSGGGGGGETRTKGHSSSSSGPRSAAPTELPPLLKAMSGLLRCLTATEWLAGALTLLTRWAHSRGAQTAAGQQAASRWGAILVSGSGRRVLERLMRLHRNVLVEI
ncbi:unnamed protein product [Ectocarpus sp. CCAP 1310/34]|nr:unnamed protein product [Ectocarpus sp. CCAP 1310/34]